MKKLLFLAAFASLAFSSCTKENDIVISDNNIGGNTVKESVVKKEAKTVKIQATSGEGSSIEISTIGTAAFDETYTKTYTLTGNTISVKLYSEMPSLKSIAIYVDGEMVTMRSASCASSNYELSYEIGQ
ncbi:MAG: hypothetical protein ACXWEY_03985 [Bacteroidia bacterium]